MNVSLHKTGTYKYGLLTKGNFDSGLKVTNNDARLILRRKLNGATT